MMLLPKDHYDLTDLPDDLAAEFGGSSYIPRGPLNRCRTLRARTCRDGVMVERTSTSSSLPAPKDLLNCGHLFRHMG